MLRSSSLLTGAAALFVLSGCSTYAATAPAHASGAYGTSAPVVEHYDARATSEWRRVERDARRFVDRLDRELHLDRRQERRIRRMVVEQAYHLLETTPRRYTRRVYPFPRQWNRRYADYRSRDKMRFWRQVDNRIERVLDRYQYREFQYLTGQRRTRGYRWDNGRWYDYDHPRRDRHYRGDRYRNDRHRYDDGERRDRRADRQRDDRRDDDRDRRDDDRDRRDDDRDRRDDDRRDRRDRD